MADEHTTERQKGLVDVGASFVAHAQTTKAVEPGQGALDHPAVTAQVLGAILRHTDISITTRHYADKKRRVTAGSGTHFDGPTMNQRT